MTKFFNVRVVGSALALLYIISLADVLSVHHLPGGSQEDLVRRFWPLLLFAGLFVSSIGVIFLKEWGRRGLLIFSAFMLLGILSSYFYKIDLIPIRYALSNILVFLYFNMPQVRAQFSGKTVTWKTILVVDDDETIIKIVRPILISQGYSVLVAMTGEEGLDVAKRFKPDLVILDVILPGIKGREVCRQIKGNKETQDIPVIFLTSKDSSDDVRAELEAGAVTHLTKPVDRKILLSTVENVLKLRSK